MNEKRKPVIAEQLIDYVAGQIAVGACPAGSRLPSVRRLADRFRISYNAALRGIDYLCDQGLLSKSAQRGVFVNAPPAPAAAESGRRCLAVVAIRPEHFLHGGMLHTALQAIQSMALARGYALLVEPLEYDTYPLDRRWERINESCAAVILLHEFDQVWDKLPFSIPVVGVLIENDYQGTISTVGIDPFNTAEQAAAFFRKHGKLRVAVISNDKPVYVRRGRIFSEALQAAGGEIVGWHTSTSWAQPDLTYDETIGYFFTSDNAFHDCAGRFEEKNAGEALAGQVVALSVDGKSLICPWLRRCPTIAADWKQIGAEAFEECERRLRSPESGPRRIYLTGRLSRSNLIPQEVENRVCQIKEPSS